jgi:hypothetical protein
VKSPRLTAEVPHSQEGDEEVEVDVVGKDMGHPHPSTTDRSRIPLESVHRVPDETHRTAKELGIPMPSPTIKPLVTAVGLLIMISGMLFVHRDSKALFYTLVLGGAALLVGSLYAWLTTPLEEEH